MMKTRRMQKWIALTLALVCLFPWPGAEAASAYPYTAFTTASLRLRQRPSDSAQILCTIPRGDAVLVTGESGLYAIVQYEGREGYALKSYLTSEGGAQAPATAQTPSPAAASNYTLLYSGNTGEEVTALQQALDELGFYSGAADGIFGAGTKNAVLAFQLKNGLSQTGTADEATQTLLYEGKPLNSRGRKTAVKTVSPAANAVVASGGTGAMVSKLQSRLRELGYYSGFVDGICGAGTVSAIRAFQKKAGLKQTGKADETTRSLLYAATAPRKNATATPANAPEQTAIPTNAPTAVPAAAYPFSTYTLVSVNMRKAPSASAARMLTIPKGAEISVLAMENGFLKVTYGNQTGYVAQDYVLVPTQYLPGKTLTGDAQAQQDYAYLKFGATGQNVIALQEALREMGFMTAAADGTFGTSTLTAVKAFQSKNGLRQDGEATPEMQKLIFEGRPKNSKGKSYTVKTVPNVAYFQMVEGDKGEPVKALQTALSALAYYSGAISGTFDRATDRAVRKFQSEHHLTVDGKAGEKTLRLLYALAAKPTPTPDIPYDQPTVQPTNTPITAANVVVMRAGTRGTAVQRLQKRLMELGYYTCSADAVYDSDDIAAVRSFQQRNGLKVDGVAGLDTQQLLYSDKALPAILITPTPVPTPLPTQPSLPVPTAIAPTPAVSLPDMTLTLRTGASGEAVVALQTALRTLGYYQGDIDGQYGRGTMTAVILFQRQNGLKADGVAGPATLTKLYSPGGTVTVPTATPLPAPVLPDTQPDISTNVTLKMGSSGNAVRSMQQRLVTLGYLNAADGIFGAKTYAAVKSFQKRNSLSSDGVAGKMTLARLNSSAAIPAAGATILPDSGNNANTGTFTAPKASEVRYANWYSEIRARAKLMPNVVIYDPDSGLHYNLHMFSFGKHADSEPPTAADTAIMNQVCGVNSWRAKYVWVIFSDGRVYIASTHSHGHTVDHTANNDLTGHICLHFPRVMSEAEATGPYAVSHQKEILWGWELTQAMIR